ncbi:hypothetical protein FGRMN_8597 [Fusarium graminum]|nr:hypothetical protein FGRMN_8597 [Fusarium graminum]
MTLPKSDEEIKRGWTNKERSFEAWYERNREEISKTRRYDAKSDAFELLFSRSYHKKDLKAYSAWRDEWLGRQLVRMSYKMTARELFQAILNTNFADMGSASNLFWQMDTFKMPFIYLGQSQFGGHLTCYGIKPSGRFLRPDIENNEDGAIGNQVLALNFAWGAVVDTKPRSLSDASDSSNPFTSESSVSTVPSVFSDVSKRPPSANRVRASTGLDPVIKARGEIDPNHFVFAQVGILHVFGGEWDLVLSGLSAPKDGTWWSNGFAIVVRLSPEGIPGAVYALYNHDQQYDLRAGDESFDDDVDDCGEAANHIPGHLHPRCKEGFRLAKIADSLKELGRPVKRFTFLPIARVENKIVRAKICQSKINYEMKNGQKVWDWYIAPTTGNWKESAKKKEQAKPLEETKRFQNQPAERPQELGPGQKAMRGIRPEWRK